MKRFKLIAALALVLTGLLVCSAHASSIIEIAVNAKLKEDGSAKITQIWRANITDKGSEFYIPIAGATLGDMELKGFTVHDESGREFINEGMNWNSDRSAAQKSGRCGVARTDSGFELCWGLGEQGERTYTVSWTYTNLVKAYDDYDGFNVRFVNDSISPAPDRVTVTAEKEGYSFKSGDVDMWAFGYEGTVLPVDGKIVAANDPDSQWLDRNYVNLMLRFKKGLFKPTSRVSGEFSSLVEQAMEDTPGSSFVRKLDIHVKLNDDGSARMLQTWDVYSHSNITQFCLPLENRSDIEIKDFSVRDESGASLTNVGFDWDLDAPAVKTRGRCGIAEDKESLKLCWGRGLVGDHTYSVSCRLTDLVRSFSDYDGADFIFIPEGLYPPPKSVRLIIEKPGYSFKEDDLKMWSLWSFMSEADAKLEDGRIIVSVRTPGKEWKSDYSLNVALRFKKGLFSPANKIDSTFGSVIGKKIRAAQFKEWALILFAALIPTALIYFSLRFIYRLCRRIVTSTYRRFKYGPGLYPEPLRTFLKKRRGRAVRKFDKELKAASWAREIPFGGDLRLVNFAVLNTPFAVTIRKTSLVEAYFLRLVKLGLLLVQKKDGSAKSTALVIVDKPDVTGRLKDDELELFYMLKEAAGENMILESNEFNNWGKTSSNRKKMQKWRDSFESYGKRTFEQNDWSNSKEPGSPNLIRKLFGSRDACSLTHQGMDMLKKTVGFRKYLLDFTLLNERLAVEVELWDDYLVLASLFNCAKEVGAEFLKLKPDFEFTSEILKSSRDFDMTSVSSAASSFYEATRERPTSSSSYSGGSSYSSSSGGSSYSSGGGGSSGGGSGGGIR